MIQIYYYFLIITTNELLFSMSIIERIYKLAEYKGDSIYKLSKDLEVSNGYFAKQRKINGAISSNIIEKIVSYYDDVNLEWLIKGTGEIITSKEAINSDEQSLVEQNNALQNEDDIVKRLLYYTNQIHRLAKSIEKTNMMNFKINLDEKIRYKQYGKYRKLIKEAKLFEQSIINELGNDIFKLQENIISINSINEKLDFLISKCKYMISILNENLHILIDEFYTLMNLENKDLDIFDEALSKVKNKK